MRIREAADGDVPAITRLVNLAYRVEDFFIEGNRTDEAEIRGLLEKGRFLLLEEEGTLSGCVYLELRDGRGYLGLLSVDPARQAGGRGRRLVGAVEDTCREAGYDEVELTVVSVRTELPAFYERLGYQPVGSLPWPAGESGRLKMPAHFVLYRKLLAG